MAIKYPNNRSVCVRDTGIAANKRRRRKLIIFTEEYNQALHELKKTRKVCT